MKKLSLYLVIIFGVSLIIYAGIVFSKKSVQNTVAPSPYQPITMRREVFAGVDSTTLWRGQGKNEVLLQRSRNQPHVWPVEDGVIVDQPEVILISNDRPSTGLNLAGVDEVIFNPPSGDIVIVGYENIKDNKPFNSVVTVLNPAGDSLVSYSYEQLAKLGLPTSYVLPLVLTDDGSVLYVKAFTGKRGGDLCDQHGLYAISIPKLTVTKLYQTPGCDAPGHPVASDAVENIVTVVPSMNMAILTRGYDNMNLFHLDLTSKKVTSLLDAKTVGVSWTYPDEHFLSGANLLLDNNVTTASRYAPNVKGFHILNLTTGVLTKTVEEGGDVIGWTPDGKDVLWRVYDRPGSDNEAFTLYALDPVTKKAVRIYRHENQDRSATNPKATVEDLLGVVQP